MNPVSLLLLTLVGAYLVGGIPFGYLVARWQGVNIFEHGSGNIGATNVGRVLGRKFGILVFILDFVKGVVPSVLAMALAHSLQVEEGWSGDLFGVAAGLAAFLGHLFPPYLRFRGGKGVATGAGVVVVLFPGPAAAALVSWLVVVLATRMVSLASLTAAVSLCLVHLSATPAPFGEDRIWATLFCLLAAGLVVLRHRANIKRILSGQENRLEESFAMNQFNKTVHVMALGLWFGSAAFFILIVTVSIFDTYEKLGANAQRPAWFPVQNTIYAKHPDGPKEQGSRAAGHTVGPLFTWFFLLQGVCGLLAAATCLSWPRSHPAEKIHKVRSGLVLAALITVLVGWPIEQYVVELRGPRNEHMDEYLKAWPAETDAQRDAKDAARRDFALWHLASLGLSFVTLVLVAAAMALAARLPEMPEPAPETARPPVTLQDEDTVHQSVPFVKDAGTAKTSVEMKYDKG